jgi:hypothetical protein
VITFDTWGDICRSVSMKVSILLNFKRAFIQKYCLFSLKNIKINSTLQNPVWVIYFLIVVVFIGFFLQNLLVGQIATQV